MNLVNIISLRKGKTYGQCSEICGVNHSYMPIVVNFVKNIKFAMWYMNETDL